jgi:group I intron endonuclease
MQISVIYSILNRITNEIYIGSAIDYISRWRNHKNLLLSNKHYNTKLQNSWNFYGKDNFIFEILEYVSDKNNLIIREQYYLDTILFALENNNRFNQLGFNTLRKAESSLGYKHTKENIEKMSGKNNPMYGKTSPFIGRKHTEESKELISKNKKGKSLKEKNQFYGKQHTEESKLKMSESRKTKSRKKPILPSKNRKIVLQYDKDNNFIKEWSHSGEASEVLGITREGIGACCLDRQKTHKGFIWKYKEENKKSSDEIIIEILKLYNESDITQREICKLYRISPNKLSKIIKGELILL